MKKTLGLLAFEAMGLTLILAKRIEISTLVMGLALFVLLLVYFVLGRLPKLENAAAALTVYLPFSKQLSQDLGAFPTGFQALMAMILLIAVQDALAWIKKEEVAAPYQSWRQSTVFFPFAILTGWAFISMLRSIQGGDISFYQAVSQYLEVWIAPFLLYFIFFRALRSREAFVLCGAGILFAASGVALVTLYEAFSIGDASIEESRVGSIANEPNILAAFLNLCAFLPVGVLLTYFKERRAWLMLIPFLLILRALMVTYSRGGYLAFAAGFFAAAVFRKKWLILPLIIGSLFVLLNPAFLPESIKARMAQTFDTSNPPPAYLDNDVASLKLDRSNADRIEVWKGALRMTQAHPILGVGFGLFKSRISQYWAAQIPFDPHNLYLLISSEMGLPALAMFLWILGVLFWNGFRVLKEAGPVEKALLLGALAGIVSFLVSAFFVIRVDSLEISSYFWIYAAVIMALASLSKREARS